MSDKLRVLAICMEDPEWILGGMGRHVRELYRHMSQRDDVEIDLLTAGPHEGVMDYQGYRKHHNDHLVCYKPRFPGMSSLLTMDIQVLKTFMRLVLEGRRWDVVHVHEWNSVQAARFVRETLQIPMIGTMHLCITKLSQMEDCPTDSRQQGSFVRNLLQKIPWLPVRKNGFTEDYIYLLQQECNLITNPEELILCSEAYVKMARQVFMTERPINMIYNGIDLNVWNPQAGDGDRARRKHELPLDRPIALYVGRIADMKGIRPLLSAIEREDTGYCLVISGEVNANDDEAKESWDVTRKLRRIERYYPERLRWVGFHQDQELRDLYAVADVGIMPSIHEPFGIVALEFMAMGVPLIATEADGLGEIVANGEEEYAMIIAPRADDIIESLRILRASGARQQLRELGLRRVRDFDWNVAAEQTVVVYREALNAAHQQSADRHANS